MSGRKFAAGLLAMACLLMSMSSVYAQAANVQRIDLTSKGYRMAVSQDGKIAAVFEDANILDYDPAKATSGIRLIDLNTGKDIKVLEGSADYITDAAFSPDNKHL